MKKIIVLLAVIFIVLICTEATLNAGLREDFDITRMWVVNRSGNVWVRVLYNGPKPFRGDVYFGVWFNNGIKRPVKKRLVFTDQNSTYDLIVCNFSHLGTNSGEGKVKIKVDVTSQYPETNENNNVFEKKVYFAEISKIKLEASPVGVALKKGDLKKFLLKATFTVKGRGIVELSYFKKYIRRRMKGEEWQNLPGELLTSIKTGPSTFYSKLKSEYYNVKVETITWNKYESFDINAEDEEIQKGSYKILTERPSRAASNTASWTVQYRK